MLVFSARGGDGEEGAAADAAADAGGLCLEGVRIVAPSAQREQMKIRMPGGSGAESGRGALGVEPMLKELLVREVGGMDLHDHASTS